MLLAIDIGNTNITLGLYDHKNVLQHHWRIKTDYGRMADEYGIIVLGLMRHDGVDFEQIRGIALASVVPPLTHKVYNRISVPKTPTTWFDEVGISLSRISRVV